LTLKKANDAAPHKKAGRLTGGRAGGMLSNKIGEGVIPKTYGA
jgi:hypothetical protein